MPFNIRNGSVKLDESEMYYASFGSGEKKLIILPGLSDGLATVKGKALLLAAPYRKYFNEFTMLMFSRKEPLPEKYSIREMAADQASAMKLLGMKKASVLGVSQGGMIAQYLAIDHPEMVEKLVLAVTRPRADELVRSNVEKWMSLAINGDHKSLMIDTAEKSYSEAYLKKYRKVYPVIGAVGKPADYGRFLSNADAIMNFDATGELDKISCPVLIIAGQEDKIVGADASYELHEKISGSELFVYEGLGHAAYEEAADFNGRVFAFLQR